MATHRLSVLAGWPSHVRRSSPTRAIGLDGGGTDARTATFLDRVEAQVAVRLATTPEKVVIPIGLVVLCKNWAFPWRLEVAVESSR